MLEFHFTSEKKKCKMFEEICKVINLNNYKFKIQKMELVLQYDFVFDIEVNGQTQIFNFKFTKIDKSLMWEKKHLLLL